MTIKENIKDKSTEIKDMPPVPYSVWESSMARADLRNKRLCIILLVSIILTVLSNAAWLYVWQSYEYVDETISVDSKDGGNANYLGGNGDINNGIGESCKTDTTQEER